MADDVQYAKRTRSGKVRVVLACAGVFHFGASCAFWLIDFAFAFAMGLLSNPAHVRLLAIDALPAFLLFGVFISCLRQGARTERHASALLILALLVSVAVFAYDVSTERYQMTLRGMDGTLQPFYYTWWWYCW